MFAHRWLNSNYFKGEVLIFRRRKRRGTFEERESGMDLSNEQWKRNQYRKRGISGRILVILKMFSKSIVTVLYFGICLVADAALVTDFAAATLKAIGLSPGATTPRSPEAQGSWPQEIRNDIAAWRQRYVEKPASVVQTRFLDDVSRFLETILLDNGGPSDFTPFSPASPEQVAHSVVLHLYTRPNGDHNMTGPVSSLVKQGFQPNATTVVLIHGYAHDTSGAAVQPIKNRLLATISQPVNVIGVDWGKLCPDHHYIWSRANVKPTGDYLGTWLAEVVQENLLRPSDIHIVGHSLGAHVAGSAGAAVYERLGEKVRRVTGLDPAFPLFALPADSESGKLDKTDATFVDVIHTAIDTYGIREALGHVDFYANGGTVPQPGCGLDPTFSCSHERVCFLFAESVGRPDSFPAKYCADSENVKKEDCLGFTGTAGYNCSTSEGSYYFETMGSQPYDPESHSLLRSSTAST